MPVLESPEEWSLAVFGVRSVEIDVLVQIGTLQIPHPRALRPIGDFLGQIRFLLFPDMVGGPLFVQSVSNVHML